MTFVLINSAHEVFPKTRLDARSIPYWTRDVKPLKTDLMFWHWVWKECGKPAEGAIADLYRNCKRKYHYAIRKIRRNENAMRNARMAEHVANNNSRDLWHELNKTKPRSKVIPPHIDGSTDNKDICQIFADKYEMLYNSLPSDCNHVQSKAQSYIEFSEPCHFHLDHVIKAINKLKPQKGDGDHGLTSDMVIKSSELWKELLAKVITAIFTHGYYPEELCKSTIFSIPKNPFGNICDADNFRGIALSSPINKVIDWIILHEYKASLGTSDLQFAFKHKSSTTMCSLMLKESGSLLF